MTGLHFIAVGALATVAGLFLRVRADQSRSRDGLSGVGYALVCAVAYGFLIVGFAFLTPAILEVYATVGKWSYEFFELRGVLP